MARTLLLARLRRRLADARACLPDAPPAPPRAINRRAALTMMAAAAATACSQETTLKPDADKSTVAVVGGGVSGLVTAWRLALAGVPVELFEASGRLGGRMHTLRDFTPDRQFCELGGEFVDAEDAALLKLCGELGVGVERIRPEGAASGALYDVGGAQRTDADLLDPVAETGAFIPVAARIAADQAALLNASGEWTARARQLDALPLSGYLDSLRDTSEGWVIDLLALAWHVELGVPVTRQSSLNLVDMIGASSAPPLQMFNRRDETMRIAGGSSTLPETLAERLTSMPLAGRVSVQMRHELTAIARDTGGISLSFRTEAGSVQEQMFSRVVMALPFTRLRDVKGLGGLALPADKMKVIAELGYGAQAKLVVGTTAPPAGKIYSDRGFQSAWNAAAGQAGAGGILSNMIAGDGARGEEARALARLETGLRALSPELAKGLNPKLRASFFWPSHPYTKGASAACLVGQYTRFPEIAARPELDGRLMFAGEHTSAGAMGSMNGAVEAGERAARELLAGA